MTNATIQHHEALLDRFGLKVVAHLNEQALPHDISERLRVARQQALTHYKTQTAAQAATSATLSGGAAVLGGGDDMGWMGRIASALPLLALAAGLIAVNMVTNDERAREVAEVDVQLLTDELPPAAHTDPGFAQYLKFGPPGQ